MCVCVCVWGWLLSEEGAFRQGTATQRHGVGKEKGVLPGKLEPSRWGSWLGCRLSFRLFTVGKPLAQNGSSEANRGRIVAQLRGRSSCRGPGAGSWLWLVRPGGGG